MALTSSASSVTNNARKCVQQLGAGLVPATDQQQHGIDKAERAPVQAARGRAGPLLSCLQSTYSSLAVTFQPSQDVECDNDMKITWGMRRRAGWATKWRTSLGHSMTLNALQQQITAQHAKTTG
jgi:hypothetical protein